MGVGAIFVSTLALSELKFPTTRPKARKSSWRPPCKSSSPLSSSVPSSSVGLILPISVVYRNADRVSYVNITDGLSIPFFSVSRQDPVSHGFVDEDLDLRSGPVGSRTSGLGDLDQTARVSTSLANRDLDVMRKLETDPRSRLGWEIFEVDRNGEDDCTDTYGRIVKVRNLGFDRFHLPSSTRNLTRLPSLCFFCDTGGCPGHPGFV
jgi:hypothetical protein